MLFHVHHTKLVEFHTGHLSDVWKNPKKNMHFFTVKIGFMERNDFQQLTARQKIIYFYIVEQLIRMKKETGILRVSSPNPVERLAESEVILLGTTLEFLRIVRHKYVPHRCPLDKEIEIEIEIEEKLHLQKEEGKMSDEESAKGLAYLEAAKIKLGIT